MLMGEALLARLKVDAGVATIAGTRIFWRVRPQSGPGSSLPALVLSLLGEARPQHLDGFEDMATSRVQASAFADNYGDSRALIEALVAAAAPEAEVTADDGSKISFWAADVDLGPDLGEQTDQGFVHHATADLTLRWTAVPAP